MKGDRRRKVFEISDIYSIDTEIKQGVNSGYCKWRRGNILKISQKNLIKII